MRLDLGLEGLPSRRCERGRVCSADSSRRLRPPRRSGPPDEHDGVTRGAVGVSRGVGLAFLGHSVPPQCDRVTAWRQDPSCHCPSELLQCPAPRREDFLHVMGLPPPTTRSPALRPSPPSSVHWPKIGRIAPLRDVATASPARQPDRTRTRSRPSATLGRSKPFGLAALLDALLLSSPHSARRGCTRAGSWPGCPTAWRAGPCARPRNILSFLGSFIDLAELGVGVLLHLDRVPRPAGR